MRILVWLGGVLAVVALTAGAALADGRHTVATSPVAIAKPAIPADPHQEFAYVGPPHEYPKPSPVPSPTPPPPPPPPAAPVRVAPAAPAPAPALVIGSTQQALVNRDRGSAGLRPLTWSSCLYAVALSNARRMAAQGFISHANGPYADLACHLGSYGGENVGYWTGGVDDAQLNTMFMNSPDHRANIMGPYHYVATAWATAPNGTAYIAVEFA